MRPEVSVDFRTVIRSELLKRTKDNPRFSLRTFARQIGVSAATLSGVLSGKRILSVKKASKIARELGLSPTETKSFVQDVALAQDPRRQGATVDKIEMKQLATDTFAAIADWFHYAITELTFIKGKKLDPGAIAKELGCTYVEAADALERLKRLGILVEQDGAYKKADQHLTTGTDYSSAAMRRLHMQFLERAKQSLLTDPIDRRDFTSMTMAIDSTKLREAKARIKEFRRELCALLEDGKRDQIYTLTVNLFPLSRGRK
ncbi:MAG: TIGR02147 family protein [Pseudomonadota bacterium]